MTLMKDVYAGSVVAGDIKINYYDSAPNATDKETILLLHGTGGSAVNNFWAVFPMLAMRHRVVALDFVDPPEDIPNAEDYIRQVHAVAEVINGGRPVHVVGYSFGAVIAALFAAQYGSLTASLSLVAGWVKTDTQQKLRNSVWQMLHDSDHDALASFSVFTNFSQAFLNTKNDAEIQGLIQSVRNGPDRSRKMAFNRTVDISEAAAGIEAPSLVIGCRHDQTAPIRHSRMLFGAIKNSRYAEVISGHGIVHERPAELFNMIDMFVQNPNGLPAGHIVQNTHV